MIDGVFAVGNDGQIGFAEAQALTPADIAAMQQQVRALAAWLAIRLRACTLVEVAEHFSRSPSTLSHLVANLEKLSRSSGEPADALRKHLYAISQAPFYRTTAEANRDRVTRKYNLAKDDLS